MYSSLWTENMLRGYCQGSSFISGLLRTSGDGRCGSSLGKAHRYAFVLVSVIRFGNSQVRLSDTVSVLVLVPGCFKLGKVEDAVLRFKWKRINCLWQRYNFLKNFLLLETVGDYSFKLEDFQCVKNKKRFIRSPSNWWYELKIPCNIPLNGGISGLLRIEKYLRIVKSCSLGVAVLSWLMSCFCILFA